MGLVQGTLLGSDLCRYLFVESCSLCPVLQFEQLEGIEWYL